MSEGSLNRDFKVQFGLVHDCIRACVYVDHIARAKRPEGAWISFKDILYSEVVITWCQVFGTDAEDSHWKKFVSKFSKLPNDLRPFSTDVVVEYLKIDYASWSEFHRSMVKARNARLAHMNLDSSVGELPNVTWALHSCYVYRAWLLQLLLPLSKPTESADLEPQSSEVMLREFREQIVEICPEFKSD